MLSSKSAQFLEYMDLRTRTRGLDDPSQDCHPPRASAPKTWRPFCTPQLNSLNLPMTSTLRISIADLGHRAGNTDVCPGCDT